MIFGAGPGGLVAALALLRAGFEPEVFERAASLAGGSGLTLWPNALRVLDRVGLADAIRKVTRPFDSIAMYERGGKTLFRLRGNHMAARFGHSGLAIERAEFLQILIDHVGRERVHFGKACSGFEQDRASVSAQFDDGSMVSGEALIGADGLHSTIRGTLFGGFEPRFAGYTVLRGVCEFPARENAAVTSLGRGLQFGIFPMTKKRVYWFASHVQKESNGRSYRTDDILSRFAQWHAPVPALIASTPRASILTNDIFDTDPMPQWSEGRVTLLGDAAHPATPDLGQGSCQAIEDAAVLAKQLRTSPDVRTALLAYEEERRPRTSSIMLQSRRIGKAGTWTNPVLCFLRNRVIGAMPERLHLSQLQEIFGFEVSS